MSKRTQTYNAATNPKDFWPTPFPVTARLSSHLAPGTKFIEPCAGNGAISVGLTLLGHHCIEAYDINPSSSAVTRRDAVGTPVKGKLVITNPPFRWDLLFPLLDTWVGECETWLLLPWDMTCNKRFNKYAGFIDRMLPIGRVSWLGNGVGGFENFGWLHFSTEEKGLIMPR